MPLDNVDNISNKYNTKAYSSVQNKIGSYTLNKEEKEQVWQIVEQREKDLVKEDREANMPNTYNARVDQEVDRIRGEEQPVLENINEPSWAGNGRNDAIRNQAHASVRNDMKEKLKDIRQEADNKINKILDNAKENGRGPNERNEGQTQDQQQNPNNDHDRR